MLLIDDQGELILSPVLEALQLRGFHDLSPDLHLFDDSSGEEFLLVLALFSGRAGGLRPRGNNDPELTSFQFAVEDRYPQQPTPPTHDSKFPASANLMLCFSCHGAPGIRSVQSIFSTRYFPGGPFLVPRSIADELSTVVHWKQTQYNWDLLRSLTEPRPKPLF